MNLPPPAQRRAILQQLSKRFGAQAPRMVFPQGLPRVKAIGPNTGVIFKNPSASDAGKNTPPRPPPMQSIRRWG